MKKGMKQFVIFTFSVVLAFSLWGCGGDPFLEADNSSGTLEANPSPEATEHLLVLDDLEVGETIQLGEFSFETNAILNPSAPKIEAVENSDNFTWIVLEVDNDKALVISENIIGRMPYHDQEEDNITWENSYIREWLNSDFYNSLPANVQGKILTTDVVNEESRSYPTGETPASGGNDTKDKIFLLSQDEADAHYAEYYGYKAIAYFAGDEERRASVNIDKDVMNEVSADWWLRSISGSTADSIPAAITTEGGVGGAYMTCLYFGIRPAFWIKL